MTEAEWLDCTDPAPMLEFVWERATLRKRRLAAVACCRRIWHLLTDQLSRDAVELAERAADGLASDDDLAVMAETYDGNVLPNDEDAPPPVWAVRCATLPADPNNGLYGDPIMTFGGEGSFWSAANAYEDPSQRLVEKAAQCHLLRDVFGNPFRPVTINPAWAAWSDSTVVKIAQGIYDERAFDRLPILADALEEAGYDNADILAHCRQPGEHVRGCWVVDLILGRE